MSAQKQLAPRIAELRQYCREAEHGTRARYMTGCRCLRCRAANSNYNTSRRAAIENGDFRGLVSAERALAHIKKLSAGGIGYKAVADAAGVSPTVVSRLLWGDKRFLRVPTEAAILSVDREALADHALVPAGPTWDKIRRLLDDGYTKTQIAKWLGSRAKTPALQLRQDFITAKSALAVERLLKKLDAGLLRRDR